MIACFSFMNTLFTHFVSFKPPVGAYTCLQFIELHIGRFGALFYRPCIISIVIKL